VFLEREYKKASLAGGESFTGFMAKHANVEIGLNLRSDRWAGADHWQAAGEPLTFDDLLRRSEVVVVGIDGGGLDDLLGLALLGRCRETGRWLLWVHAWAHKIALQRRQEIAPRLLDFQRDGDLTIVDLPGQDVLDVADIICRVRDAGLLPEKAGIGVDAAGITDIVDELTSEARGFDMTQIVGISQGWRLNGAIKTCERKLAGKQLKHGAAPLMAWCVSNARTVLQGNAVSITKAVSGTGKIDPLMALFDAASLMGMNPVAAGGRSWWDQPEAA
jgi:phage terminase large subunit-like protein